MEEPAKEDEERDVRGTVCFLPVIDFFCGEEAGMVGPPPRAVADDFDFAEVVRRD